MKRILIKTSLSYDGVAAVTMNYYRSFSSQDFYIDFYIKKGSIVRDDYKKYITDSMKSHIYCYVFDFKSILKYVFSTYKLLRKYDVYHVNGSSANITLDLIVAFIARVKIRIAHSHSTSCKHKFFHYLLKPFLPIFSTANIACSLNAGKWMFSVKKYSVLYNGIETSLFSFNLKYRDEIRNKYGIDKFKKVILNIGFLYEVKNQKFLINILKKMLQENNDYVLILIGSGVLNNQLHELATSLNISNQVFFLGNTIEIYKFYSAADIFILTSFYEGLPVTLVEAQYSGMNCVFPNHITDEVIIHKDICHKLDLSLGINQWAEYVKSIKIEDRLTKFSDSRFDIKKNILKLEKIYMGINNE